MKKRYLYKIEQFENCCIIYRLDNNYGRQGVVYKDVDEHWKIKIGCHLLVDTQIEEFVNRFTDWNKNE